MKRFTLLPLLLLTPLLLTPLLLAPLLLAPSASHAVSVSGPDAAACTQIISAIERLACFDAQAGTPPRPVERTERTGSIDPAPMGLPGLLPDEPALALDIAPPVTADQPPPNLPAPNLGTTPGTTLASDLVRMNEASRQAGDTEFLLSHTLDQQAGQHRVMISAPAQAAGPPTYLAISCLSNISRLQLVAEQPIERDQISIRLHIDERPLSAARRWRVLDEGNVVDAGRGLVAIEQLRPFVAGAQLRVESDYAPLNGLTFNATGLQALLARQREACHW